MYNIFLDERTARDIDKLVAKVIRDLDNPEPPLDLSLVREVLELDRAYYSSTDTGVLEETVHRLWLAGKQVVKRPSRLLDVVRRRELKALWVPDRRRILIDAEMPKAKQRWGESHEVIHSVVPWHQEMLHGDKERTLRLACEEQLEAEANYGAGRLLFLRDEFRERLQGFGAVSFDCVRGLAKDFGNTMTSSLWRVVETMDSPAFGIVGQHPRRPEHPDRASIRYFLRSRIFADQFQGVVPLGVYTALQRFCFGNRGPIGSDEVVLTDVNGERHVFLVEVFFNGHEALTLGTYRRVNPLIVAAS